MNIHLSQAARTQSARRAYFAALASNAPAWRITAAAQALRISEESLLRSVGGSKAKAQAAEAAYCNSLAAK